MVSLVPNIIYTHKMFQCNWKCFLLLKRPSIDSFFLFLKELVTTRHGTWTSVTRSDRYCNQAVVTHVLLTISISKSTKKLTHNHSDAHYFQILKATAVDLDLSDLCSTSSHGCRQVLVFYLPFSLFPPFKSYLMIHFTIEKLLTASSR